MLAISEELNEYMTELRQQVCRHCISRLPGAPPCEALGVGCGVEQHLQQLIDVCRAVDSPLIDPYTERMREEICQDCEFQDQPVCPCPLRYLLPLAVGAVEAVEYRRRVLESLSAPPTDEVPETD